LFENLPTALGIELPTASQGVPANKRLADTDSHETIHGSNF